MTNNSTFKLSVFIFVMVTIFVLPNCTPTQKVTKSDEVPDEAVASVTYTAQIEPIMKRSCTPCHYPDQGRMEMLNTYEKVKSHAKEILERVELAPDASGFMPFKSKKQPLNGDEIALLKTWISNGMPK